MTDVGKWLRDADPVAHPGDDAEGLSPLDAQAMRRAMLTSIDARRTTRLLWPHPLAIAATIALTLAAGVGVGRRLPPPREAPAIAQVAAAPAARRQLQFATPGGTRVIWVFNPEFEP